jgi:hypothetical protein
MGGRRRQKAKAAVRYARPNRPSQKMRKAQAVGTQGGANLKRRALLTPAGSSGVAVGSSTSATGGNQAGLGSQRGWGAAEPKAKWLARPPCSRSPPVRATARSPSPPLPRARREDEEHFVTDSSEGASSEVSEASDGQEGEWRGISAPDGRAEAPGAVTAAGQEEGPPPMVPVPCSGQTGIERWPRFTRSLREFETDRWGYSVPVKRTQWLARLIAWHLDTYERVGAAPLLLTLFTGYLHATLETSLFAADLCLPGSRHECITLDLDLESPSNAWDATRPPSPTEGRWLDLFISRLKEGSWQSKGSLVRVPFGEFAALFQQTKEELGLGPFGRDVAHPERSAVARSSGEDSRCRVAPPWVNFRKGKAIVRRRRNAAELAPQRSRPSSGGGGSEAASRGRGRSARRSKPRQDAVAVDVSRAGPH